MPNSTPPRSSKSVDQIALTEYSDAPVCFGYEWLVGHKEKLSELVAWLLIGQATFVAAVLSGHSPPSVKATNRSIDARIAELLNPPVVWHRDGLLFQMVSWVAVRADDVPPDDILLRGPQVLPADKGLDGFFISGLSGPVEGLSVVICEDKATEKPRSTIRSKVWPEIVELEKGSRDHEIVAAIDALASGRVSQVKLESMLADTFIKNRKKYRISITVSPTDGFRDSSGRRKLFKGFDSKAPGDLDRRRGEILELEDLREWMNDFAKLVAGKLEGLKEP